MTENPTLHGTRAYGEYHPPRRAPAQTAVVRFAKTARQLAAERAVAAVLVRTAGLEWDRANPWPVRSLSGNSAWVRERLAARARHLRRVAVALGLDADTATRLADEEIAAFVRSSRPAVG